MRKPHKFTIGSALSAVAMAALTASAFAAGAPSVLAMNQKLKGSDVSITYANMPKDGYLVIHPSLDNGKPSEKVLGSAQLTAGDHREIKVQLNDHVAAGTKLWAELQPTNDAKGAMKPYADFGHAVEQSFKIL